MVGLCECGCGQATNTAKWDRPNRGVKRGEHFRFVAGHHPHGWPNGRGKRVMKPQTAEHKKKISDALLLAFKEGRTVGHYTPRKTPLVYTVETRKVMSEKSKELWRDPEYRRRISASRKGLLAGEKHPMFGKPRSEETRIKISEAKKGKRIPEEIRVRMNRDKIGVPQSAKHRKNISESRKGYKPTAEALRKSLSCSSPNRQELKILAILDLLYPGEWKFVGNGQLIIAGKCPDFVNVNGQKKIIEFWGDFWHQGEKPDDRAAVFSPFGYRTLVIRDSEMKKPENVINRIHAFMEM